jgi:hypothetical protein
MSIFEDQFASMHVSNWSNLSPVIASKQAPQKSFQSLSKILQMLLKRLVLVSGVTILTSPASNALPIFTESTGNWNNIVISENFVSAKTSSSSSTILTYEFPVGKSQSLESVKVDSSDLSTESIALDTPFIEVNKEPILSLVQNLSEHTLNIVTDHGVNRIKHFSSLNPGWDRGQGNTLSRDSLKSFDQFFSMGDFIVKDLSVFMSSDGNLIANWLLNEETTVELEFEKELIHYFNEASGDEYSIARRRAGDFKNYLKRNASNV